MTSAQIDHFLLGCRNLERGIDQIEHLTGVRAATGGRHPGLGTHNALMSLGEKCYLEIICPDPGQKGGPWASRIPDTDEPTLFHWAIAVTNLADLAAQLPNKLTGGAAPTKGARKSPALGEISWAMLMLNGGPHGALMPFLLDWGKSRHPAASAPSCGSISAINISSPKAPELIDYYAMMGLAQDVSNSDKSKMELVLDTPSGQVNFKMANPKRPGLSFHKVLE